MIQWYDEKNNLLIVYFPFPAGVDEFITENPDGSYTAFIGQNLPPDQMHRAYLHALAHIRNKDFEDGVDVQKAEMKAHKEDKDEAP